MTTNYHTPWTETTDFKPTHMNPPLAELDAQITIDVAAIAALAARCDALEAQVFNMSPSVSPSVSPSISPSVSPSISPSVSPS